MAIRIALCVGLIWVIGCSQNGGPVPTHPADGESKAVPSPAPAAVGFGPLTVSDVLNALRLDESALEYIDEPPGKLRQIRCATTLRDTKVRTTVRIDLVYTPALMSTTGKWDPQKVRAAKVVKVTLGEQAPE